MQVDPRTIDSSNQPNYWSGFLCGLSTDIPFPSSNSYTITQCRYIGPLVGGSFVATGYTGGSTTYSTNISISQCVAIIQSPTYYSVNAGGFCGNQMRLHSTTIEQSIVNFNELISFNNQDVGGFFGSLCGNFIINNSYLIWDYESFTIPTNSILYVIGMQMNSGNTGNIDSCYFVSSTSNSLPFQSFNGNGIDLIVQNCAFQDGYIYNFSRTWNNNITNYTYSTTDPQTINPFSLWNLSTIWTLSSNTSSPLLLQTFQISPFLPSSYTEANDILSLTNLCIFEGTFVLTLDGYKKIEKITTQDSLVTADGQITKIKQIIPFFNPCLSCVHIPPHFFQENIPFDHVYVSLYHALFVNNTYIHPIHRMDIFRDLVQKAKMYKKEQSFCIETVDYENDLLLWSGSSVEGYGMQDKYIWDCRKSIEIGCQRFRIK